MYPFPLLARGGSSRAGISSAASKPFAARTKEEGFP